VLCRDPWFVVVGELKSVPKHWVEVLHSTLGTVSSEVAQIVVLIDIVIIPEVVCCQIRIE
jgi:hypothetical protein